MVLPRLAQGQVPNLLLVMAGRLDLPAPREHPRLRAVYHKLENFDRRWVGDYLRRRGLDCTPTAVDLGFELSLGGVPGRLCIIADGFAARRRNGKT
jgi:hypothetical protein